MALLIRQWQHSKLDCRTSTYYTVKVILNNRIKHEYKAVDSLAYELLLKHYARHEIIDRVKVLNKTDLF